MSTFIEQFQAKCATISENQAKIYEKGNDAGYVDGRSEGEYFGYANGYDVGKQEGYSEGLDAGIEQGRALGYNDGYESGIMIGKEERTAEYAKMLSTVAITENTSISSIPAGMFKNFTYLRAVTGGNYITDIKDSAFENCTSMTTCNIVSSTSSKVSKIEDKAFFMCRQLSINSFSDTLQEIGASAFYGCYALHTLNIPSNTDLIIGNAAFGDCAYLNTVNFMTNSQADYSSISISSTAFLNCPQLTTISVPWHEGEVKGAPWGATNATITYRGDQ